jgi:hypothetical protein
MRVVAILIVLFAGLGESSAASQDDPRELILQARTIADRHGDEVWTGYSTTPFGVLLVEEETERLFCHFGSAEEFETIGIDPVLSCPSHVRPASFPPNMLASFPAVDGIPTIVIGTPEATGKSADEWVLTIFHEHLHQMQFSWPGYYPGTTGLELDDGDESGMWMLNYPFPYENEDTARSFHVMAEKLIAVIDAQGADAFDSALQQYWSSREAAKSKVSEADWRYIELQFWQEGVARWTEAAIAALSDNLSDATEEARHRIVRELSSLDLPSQKRAAVYPIGAAEAMVLEAGGADWRASYWSEPFSLGPQLQKLIEDRAAESSAGSRRN